LGARIVTWFCTGSEWECNWFADLGADFAPRKIRMTPDPLMAFPSELRAATVAFRVVAAMTT
jgi:hypothetical protein